MGRLLGSTVALVSLAITPGLLFYFDTTPKIVLLFAGTAAALGWAAVSGIRIDRKSNAFAIFSALLLLTLASLAVSTIFSVRPELSLFGSNWRRYGSVAQAAVCLFAWAIALGCAGNPGRVRSVLRGVSMAGALSAAYGICEYFGIDPLIAAGSYRVGEGVTAIVRPPGTLGHSSYFATWLLFAVFLSLALRSMETAGAWREFAISAVFLAVGAMLLTGTRAAVLGLIAGAVIWRLVERKPIPRRVLLFAGLGALLVAVFYIAPTGQALRARVRWSVEDRWGGARLALWRDSLRMATLHLAAGYGPEVFTAEFPKSESLKLAEAYPDFAHESPHNMFLDALIAQGMPGLLVLAALCGLGLISAFRLKQPAFAAALTAAIVAQQFTAFTMPTALMLLVTVGSLIALETREAEPKRRAFVVACAAAIGLALLYIGVRFAAADHALATAKERLERADLAGSLEQYRRYEQLRLPGASADIWYSRALLAAALESPCPSARMEAATQSAAVAILATRTAEDPFNAWYNLAVVCGMQENAGCAERSLRAAISAHPNWFKPHWTLAELLSVEGRVNEALEQATLAADLDGQKHREVTNTLEAIRARRVSTQSLVLQR